jgi:hypothetical protein
LNEQGGIQRWRQRKSKTRTGQRLWASGQFLVPWRRGRGCMGLGQNICYASLPMEDGHRPDTEEIWPDFLFF